MGSKLNIYNHSTAKGCYINTITNYGNEMDINFKQGESDVEVEVDIDTCGDGGARETFFIPIDIIKKALKEIEK